MATTTHQIPVLEKTLRVLAVLAEGEGDTSASALARRVGVSQSTCYRILKTLEAAHWVRARAEGGHALSFGLLPLLAPLRDAQLAAALAQPVLDELAREWPVTAKLSAREGARQVTVAAGLPRVPIAILAPVGLPFPLVQGASGAALLADETDERIEALSEATPPADWKHDDAALLRARVAQCRRKGHVVNVGHHPQGIDAVACPVRGARVPLALSLIGHRGDFGPKALPRLVERLGEAREELERAMKEALV